VVYFAMKSLVQT